MLKDVYAVKSSDYILILGAGKNYPQSPNPNYYFLGRMKKAIEVNKTHPQCKFFLSGIKYGEHYDEAQDMRRFLIANNIPDSLLILDSLSYDTYDSIRHFKARFKNKSVVIVSQDEHLQRAVWLATTSKLNAKGLIANGYPNGTPNYFFVREFGARIKARIEVHGLQLLKNYFD
jgi:SanA protein